MMKQSIVIMWWLTILLVVLTIINVKGFTTRPAQSLFHPNTLIRPRFSVLPSSTSRRYSSSSSSSSPTTPTNSNSTTSLSRSSSPSRWDSFDYNQQWYPVYWECDVPVNAPTKVTLFDVDYVIAKDQYGNLTALVDQCPHKAAALSEGRMTSSGYLQVCVLRVWLCERKGGR